MKSMHEANKIQTYIRPLEVVKISRPFQTKHKSRKSYSCGRPQTRQTLRQKDAAVTDITLCIHTSHATNAHMHYSLRNDFYHVNGTSHKRKRTDCVQWPAYNNANKINYA